MKNNFIIQVYCDGEGSDFLNAIQEAFQKKWDADYRALGSLKFLPSKNLKQDAEKTDLNSGLIRIEQIRNPDIFFSEISSQIDLGGVEITTHSPDGSNIEKRYPFLWIAGETKITSFVATPYLKKRPGGQINRFPRRHALRNIDFLNYWDTKDANGGYLRQFVPIKELHGGDLQLVPKQLKKLLFAWEDIGHFFADLLAAKTGAKNEATALKSLGEWKRRFLELAETCINNSGRSSEATTLLKSKDRWIQVYNCRPDNGHWERGEGQFDSIDGRLMFTLDTINFIKLVNQKDVPSKFEFWLPQMVSKHSWIEEQRKAGFGSKRLRNILVELSNAITTKFADQLTDDDWKLLTENNGLMLERLDWQPGIYSIAQLMAGQSVDKIARGGMSSVSEAEINGIKQILADEKMYYSAHRCYLLDWKEDFQECLKHVSPDATILAPRIPAHLIKTIPYPSSVKIIPGEDCTRVQLRMLRQLHRAHLHIKKEKNGRTK